MPNFVNIPPQMKQFSIQALDSDCSVCMAAICYSGPLTAIPTNEQIGQTDMAKSTQLVILIIYTYICRFLLGVTNLIYPVQGIQT